MYLCECGCGQETKNGNRFLVGHSMKNKKRGPQSENHIKNRIESLKGNRSKPEPKFCECGCGEYAKSGKRFMSGHQRRKYHPKLKPCECGCGTLIIERSKSGKLRQFVHGHNMKGLFRPEVGIKIGNKLRGRKVGPLPEKTKKRWLKQGINQK